MAISDEKETKNSQNVNYKQAYRSLKRKLRSLIHENECFQAELRKVQGQYLQVHRDNEFLLDRLMQYENIESSSSDSDATESSEDEKVNSLPEVKSEPVKRKRNAESSSVESTNNCTSSSGPSGSAVKKKRTSNASTTGKGGKAKSTTAAAPSSNQTTSKQQAQVQSKQVPAVKVIKTEPTSSSSIIVPGTSSSGDLFTMDNSKLTSLPPQIFSQSPDHDSSFSH